MVNLLRDASHAEADAGHATGHRFHDGVRQVLRKRGQHKGIGSTIDLSDLALIADIA